MEIALYHKLLSLFFFLIIEPQNLLPAANPLEPLFPPLQDLSSIQYHEKSTSIAIKIVLKQYIAFYTSR
jgi:hypothetical protein